LHTAETYSRSVISWQTVVHFNKLFKPWVSVNNST